MLGVTEGKGQRDRAIFELAPMQSGQRKRPGRGKLARERRDLRRCEADQGLSINRMLLDRDEVQAPRPVWIVAPGLPRREEIHAESETGFDDDELTAPLPAFRQVVAAQENVSRLAQRAITARIDVAVEFVE